MQGMYRPRWEATSVAAEDEPKFKPRRTRRTRRKKLLCVLRVPCGLNLSSPPGLDGATAGRLAAAAGQTALDRGAFFVVVPRDDHQERQRMLIAVVAAEGAERL